MLSIQTQTAVSTHPLTIYGKGKGVDIYSAFNAAQAEGSGPQGVEEASELAGLLHTVRESPQITAYFDSVSGVAHYKSNWADKFASSTTEEVRRFIDQLETGELKRFVSLLSPKEKRALISSLAIKWNFEEKDFEALIAKCQEVQHTFDALSEALNSRGCRLGKQFWLTSEEKCHIENSIGSGRQLISTAQAIFQQLQEVHSASSKISWTEARAELLKDQLFLCCKLVQSMEAFKQFEAGVRVPEFSRPGFIKFLESPRLNTALSSFPTIATSSLSFFILAEIIFVSAFEALLFTMACDALICGLKFTASKIVSLYDYRVKQKTEDDQTIKETFGQLNQFLEETLDMSGYGHIPVTVNSHTTRLFGQAGHAVGTKLDSLDSNFSKTSETIKAELVAVKAELKNLSLAAQQPQQVNGMNGASIIPVKELKQNFSAAVQKFDDMLREKGLSGANQRAKLILQLAQAEEKDYTDVLNTLETEILKKEFSLEQTQIDSVLLGLMRQKDAWQLLTILKDQYKLEGYESFEEINNKLNKRINNIIDTQKNEKLSSEIILRVSQN